MMTLAERFGITHPIIQAPMAGSQGSALAIAVCQAGGLGSLPAAMLSVESLAAELKTIRAATDRPFNVNFFCHTPPDPDAAREDAWRALLAPFYDEAGLDVTQIAGGASRMPFSHAVADDRILAPHPFTRASKSFDGSPK